MNGKENIVCTYSEIFFSLKKEGNPVTCNNMNEPGRHLYKWNKPDIEGKILIICYHLYEECEIVKLIEAESNGGCWWGRCGGNRKYYSKGTKLQFIQDE